MIKVIVDGKVNVTRIYGYENKSEEIQSIENYFNEKDFTMYFHNLLDNIPLDRYAEVIDKAFDWIMFYNYEFEQLKKEFTFSKEMVNDIVKEIDELYKE